MMILSEIKHYVHKSTKMIILGHFSPLLNEQKFLDV